MKVKKLLSFTAITFVLFFLVTKTDVATQAVIEALNMCVVAVIPTLFPFFVISGLLVNLGVISVLGNMLAPLSRVLFKTSGKGAVVFIIGIICGYPTGAKVIAEMSKNNNLDKKEGERLLAFCNNSGPLFIIGAVGTAMLNNHTLGVTLYIIHILSAIFTGVFFRVFAEKNIPIKRSDIEVSTVGEAVSKSVEDAVKSILNVCGYVVFFGLLSAINRSVFLTSVLEVTNGAKALITLGLNKELTLILLSGILGFGGICVLLQVISAVNGAGLSVRMYILGKMLQSVIAMVLTFIYVKLFDVKTVFASINSQPDTDYLWLLVFLVPFFAYVYRLTKKI